MFSKRGHHDLSLGPGVRGRVEWAPAEGELRPWAPSGAGLHVLKQSPALLRGLRCGEERMPQRGL